MSKPYRRKDHYFKKAKQEGLRARSAFKLEEIARRFQLLKKGAHVADLGAAPGGFLQVIAQQIGPTGRAFGVDIVPIRPLNLAQVQTEVMDVLDDNFVKKFTERFPQPLDAVISDLAPKTSGIRTADEARSLRLASQALELAVARGKAQSSFAAKLFMGRDFETFRDQIREHYGDVKVVRPEATRGASVEIYLVGLKKK